MNPNPSSKHIKFNSIEETINPWLKGYRKLKNSPQNLGRKIGGKEEWWVSSTLHFLSLQEEKERLEEEDDSDDDDEGVKGWIFVEI